ncbi:MAG: hypothetical protein AAFU67_08960, partial [Bacteroidota bacterium]
YIGTASDAAIFNWDFGVGSIESGSGRGPYSVSWDEPGIYPVSLTVSEAGCVDASATVTRTLTVSAPLDSLTLRCEPATLNTVTISWDSIPGIDAYEVILEDTLPYLTLDTVLEISGLLPGDSAVISVIPLGSTACGDGPGDTITCFAAPCPELSIDFSAIDPLVCLDENTQPLFLNAVVSGGNGINASQTWSGPGVSGSIFDPRGLGPGVYWLTLSYTEKGPCGIIDSFSVKVVATPTGEFAIDPGDICFGDSVLVEYTGTAGPTAEFDWEFGEANIISGEGEGPYWLDFPDGGTYPIRLTVTEEDCSTEVSTQEDSIVVSMPVGMPLIRCGPSSINGVSFLWDPVVNATEYGVQLFGEGAFFQDTTGFIVDGLLPGDSVTIAVLPLGPPPCGNGPLDTLTCFALPCPTITVDLSTIPVSVCLDENTPQIALEAIINGGSGINPDTTWSGPGVVGNVFDPRLAGVGRHTIQLLYNELGPCEVSESHIIEVFAIPTADFNVSTNDICLGDTVEVVYIGNAVEGAFFDWDFSGASILSGSGPGPYSIVWATPGTYLVRLSVEQNACTSVGGGRIDSVQVFAPLSATEISCEGETLNSVSFSWTEVIGADGYDIEIIGGDRFTSDETFLTVDNLPLETNVTIVVTPLASNICGDGPPDTITCTTLACPLYQFELGNMQREFCIEAGAGPVRLLANVISSDQSGVITWEGEGVTASEGSFFFTPLLAGVGDFIVTLTYTGIAGCKKDTNLLFVVHPPPNADAGDDQFLTCRVNSVTLDGTASSSGPGISYEWTTDNPDVTIANANSPVVEVEGEGLYTLMVRDTNGCSNTDQVFVVLDAEIPQPSLEIGHISCFGANDGFISILEIQGGIAPYQPL